jgi:hypothetical protein
VEATAVLVQSDQLTCLRLLVEPADPVLDAVFGVARDPLAEQVTRDRTVAVDLTAASRSPSRTLSGTTTRRPPCAGPDAHSVPF